MTVNELYKKLVARLPDSLAESWDNDGLMVCPDGDAPVRRVLLALDVTETVVDFAIENRFDLILTHHPLIFRPLSSLTEDTTVGRKVIKLIKSGIAVISFHTRVDRVDGGVNDVLADLLELSEVEPLGELGKARRTVARFYVGEYLKAARVLLVSFEVSADQELIVLERQIPQKK